MSAEYGRREFCRRAVGAGAGVSTMSNSSLEAVGSSAAPAATTDASDEWPVFGHDERNTSHLPGASSVTPPLTERWRLETPWAMESSYPIVDDDLVYCNTVGGMVTLSRRTGDPQWKAEARGRPTSSPSAGPDAVYAGTGAGHVGELHDGGRRVVNYRIGSDVLSSPVPGSDGELFVATADGAVRRLTRSGDGMQARWRTQLADPLAGTPALADGSLYVGDGDGVVHAIDADTGTVDWRTDLGARCSASPAVADGRLYLPDDDGTLYALSLTDGSIVWRAALGERGVPADAYASSPAVANGRVFVGSAEGTIHAFDAETGAERWAFDAGAPVYLDPVVVGGTVYAGDVAGRVVGLTPDGSVAWETTVDGSVAGLAATATELLVTATPGKVIAYGPDDADGAGVPADAESMADDGRIDPPSSLLGDTVLLAVVIACLLVAVLGGLAGAVADGLREGRSNDRSGSGGKPHRHESAGRRRDRLPDGDEYEVNDYGELVERDE
jgi:outer membrane protein assembly factor BamB